MQRAPASQDLPEFRITRHFNAPRARVWSAWTEPKQMEQWFGPKGCQCDTKTMELRVGGICHSRITMPDGTELWGKFTYRDVTPRERLVWVHAFSDAQGGITRHPFSPNWPLTLLTTVTFADAKGGTDITLTWRPLDATDSEIATFREGLPSMDQGWGGSFEQLDTFLQG